MCTDYGHVVLGGEIVATLHGQLLLWVLLMWVTRPFRFWAVSVAASCLGNCICHLFGDVRISSDDQLAAAFAEAAAGFDGKTESDEDQLRCISMIVLYYRLQFTVAHLSVIQ